MEYGRGRQAGAAAGGAGRGAVLDVAAGRGRGNAAAVALVAGGNEGAGRGGGADASRVLTQREAMAAWEGPNINQLIPPGKQFKRKGIFLKLSPVEFKDIVLKESYIVKEDEEGNTKNRDLVGLYNDIKDLRLYSFYCIHKHLVTNAEARHLRASYEAMVEQAKSLKGEVEGMGRAAVPFPPHFTYREVIFTPAK